MRSATRRDTHAAHTTEGEREEREESGEENGGSKEVTVRLVTVMSAVPVPFIFQLGAS
jgi:hypothetical protein